MKISSQAYKPKGMNKDLSYSAFNPEYSWHNKNIRLTARDGNDLLSITNECGNLEVSIAPPLTGKVLGTCVVGDYLAVFTHATNEDRIYRISQPNINNVSTAVLLVSKDLNFNESNRIQTLPFYENDSIQKVYWVDGINQPRVINLIDTTTRYTETSFNFIQELDLNEEVTITKQYGGGSFKSGVIQYAFTYFDKNGAESNIFQITPLNYISPIDRGGKVDEIINNTFKISLTGYESKYEYVRIYSIYRTSIDTTPEVRNLIDLSIPKIRISNPGGPIINPGPQEPISFIDNGSYGSIISTDFLLYVGGEELIPGCMSQKNNTLFLGNIEAKSVLTTPTSLNELISGYDSNFSWELQGPVLLESTSEYNDSTYPYRPKSLAESDKIKHFKFDETYRLGIQGQYKNGRWSSPIWLGIDKIVDLRYQTINSPTSVNIWKTFGRLNISETLKLELNELSFIKIRPVFVPLQNSDRTVIAQGIANNTIGVVKNRYSTNPSSSTFAYPDYLFRNGGVPSDGDVSPYNAMSGLYSHYGVLKQNLKDSPIYNEVMAFTGPAGADSYTPFHNISGLPGYQNVSLLFVDKNMVNFWSPEIKYNDSINSYINNSQKAGLYGFAFNSGYSFNLGVDSGVPMTEKTYSSSVSNYSSLAVNYNRSVQPVSSQVEANRINFPMWSPAHYVTIGDGGPIKDANIPFMQFKRNGNSYFGKNINLLNSTRYELNINNPVIFSEDSTKYYKTNTEDYAQNSGNVLYSKSVEINYAGGTFVNVATADSTWVYTPNEISTGMQIKYNTAEHALFSFKQEGEYFSNLPRLANSGETLISETFAKFPEWYGNDVSFKTDVLGRLPYIGDAMDSLDDSTRNSLPIFDLYSSVINDPLNQDYNKYGGTSSDALYNNNWIPCGKSINLTDESVLRFTDGDTYIQRFDLLRVFPDDLNQIPQHTELISFICESFINLDGRSDVNRYNVDSSLMTPTNYGLLNNIYSQKNNYFNYNILDPLLFNATKFSNTIIWSKTKQSGSINDTWTNMNMLSSIDLDGVYGEVSSINLFNNKLYAFQEKGIARLLYNERIQQQSSDGVSVELANGYKVPDYRYLSNQYGCNNKWSIVEGKQGIYFIDYINKSLNVLADGIKDLSSSLGFKSWFNENTTGKDYTLSYDRKHNDLYIHDETNCLNYSELLNSFVSFYDYVNVPKMINVWGEFVSLSFSDILGDTNQFLSENSLGLLAGENDTQLVDESSILNQTKIWLSNKGEYNKFYDNLKPFSVEYLMNPEPTSDKVFNTIEYRLDNQDIDWTDLKITNWYQEGLINEVAYKVNLKRKFNVNRIQLPRQSQSLNRIRSTWARLKMSYTPSAINNNKKFDMQDLVVTYTI